MKKGQALVEFVLILPVFVLILFSVIDFGRILSAKNEMQALTSEAVKLYKKEKSYDEILNYLKKNNNDLLLSIVNTENDYTKIIIKKEINVITPGLNVIISDPYVVEVYEVFLNE